MQTLMSFWSSAIAPEPLGEILSDYLALDRARIVRRLMVARVGIVALLAVLVETLVRGFSPVARWLTLGFCLVPAAWAWIVELGRERRLSQRIDRDGALTRICPSVTAPVRLAGQKVVKSS